MLARLLERERARYVELHPRSRRLFAEARGSLLAGVPMSWMSMWSGGHPLYFAEARGNRITDVDGHTYVDFCLGDTGAMTGHSPPAVVRAVRERLEERGGVTTMLPTADAAAVGTDLARRFGLPLWQFTLTATDANRFILRMCRQISKRPWVLVFSHCYHGTVDETVIVVGPDGRPRSKRGNVGPAVDPVLTTKVVEFNDVEALRAALAPRDVACVLMEPALTNIGIVLPEPGYLDQVRRLCDETGTLLINDETHTFSAGPGGCTRAWGLRPDVITIGKALASGVPIGAYGVTAEVAERILDDPDADLIDQGGVGGTLAGNALSMAAARATLAEVLTDAAFAHMIELATAYTAGVDERACLPAGAVVHRAIGGAGRVPLLPRSAAHRRRIGGGPRRGPGRVPAPVHDQPGHPHDAVPQHGADVSRDDPRRRRPAYRGVRPGGGRAVGRLTAPDRAPGFRARPYRFSSPLGAWLGVSAFDRA